MAYNKWCADKKHDAENFGSKKQGALLVLFLGHTGTKVKNA
jgi:hypothetical protein